MNSVICNLTDRNVTSRRVKVTGKVTPENRYIQAQFEVSLSFVTL